jgi:hypothetical protein
MNGATPPSGTPDDTFAWFNLVPPYLAEKPLSYYYHLAGVVAYNKMPCPGTLNASKVWHCPSAQMSAADAAQVSGQGKGGFFSYDDNIDLKNGSKYPSWMPKLSVLPKASATVLMFDVAFNPNTEKVNDSPTYNSVNPANRYKSLGARHSKGTVLNFCDGHSRYYHWTEVTGTPYGTPPSTEPLNPDIIWDWTSR